jgi:hypothetical protein
LRDYRKANTDLFDHALAVMTKQQLTISEDIPERPAEPKSTKENRVQQNQNSNQRSRSNHSKIDKP